MAVNATGYGVEIIYLLYSFLRPGKKSKHDVEFRYSTRIASTITAERGGRSVLTQGSLKYLILLIFRYEVTHVAGGFSEFHLVHTLTRIPVEESLK